MYKPKQGIFFDNQIYDAYSFVSELVKSAKQRIILIDNYVDESVLTLLDKRGKNVSACIYTQQIGRQLRLDIERHNSQYPPIEVAVFRRSHDRFLCIDDTVYHVGASIKDLGKKWFAFSKMEDFKPEELVDRINDAIWCRKLRHQTKQTRKNLACSINKLYLCHGQQELKQLVADEIKAFDEDINLRKENGI